MKPCRYNAIINMWWKHASKCMSVITMLDWSPSTLAWYYNDVCRYSHDVRRWNVKRQQSNVLPVINWRQSLVANQCRKERLPFTWLIYTRLSLLCWAQQAHIVTILYYIRWCFIFFVSDDDRLFWCQTKPSHNKQLIN